jgi:MFS family permease
MSFMASPSPQSTPTPGPWSPLSQPVFRRMWLAVLASNIGTWIHDVSAAWVIAETTGSPFMVAAVQSATTLPVVLLAVLAGTLADIVDRRKVLILAQLWMLMVAGTLALLAHLDMLRPWSLIALTFALGIGAAMAMPAQQATIPELVPRTMLSPAVALTSLSMNIARAIGPALGGLIVASAGIAWAFAVNALSFLGVVIVLAAWRRTPTQSLLPPESFGVALCAGLRYATQGSVLQSVLIKAASFFMFASALTALLPIVVNRDLQAGAGTYGLMLGCIGIGAITGALLLPKLRAGIDPDRLVLVATVVYAWLHAGAGAVAQHPRAVRGGAGQWLCLDHRAVVAADRRADRGPCVGARSCAGLVHRRVLRRHGAGQPGLGPACAADQHHAGVAGRRRWHRAGCAVRHALQAR